MPVKVETVQRGYKYRLSLDTPEWVKQHILQNGGCSRKVYNIYVGILYNELEKSKYENGPLPKIEFPKVSRFKKDEKLRFLKDADSLGLANAELHFRSAVNRFNNQKNKSAFTKGAKKRQKNKGIKPTFRDLKGMPKFHKKKDNHYAYKTNNQNLPNGKCTVWLEGNILHVPKLKTGIELIMHRPLPEGAVIKTVTLSMEPNGDFYASLGIVFQRSVDTTILDAGLQNDRQAISKLNMIGLDYSQQNFYVDQEGRIANYPHYYVKSEKRLAYLQQQLSRMEKDSRNYEKQLTKIRKLTTKMKNQRKDFCHKLSRTLASHYDVVAVEDIDLRAMGEALHLGKNLHDNGFGMFRLFLDYKLQEKGSLLVKINRSFPSTKMCSSCGYVNGNVKLGVQKWVCPVCGAFHNRDHNAGINIQREGLAEFSKYCTLWYKEKLLAEQRAARLHAARTRKKILPA